MINHKSQDKDTEKDTDLSYLFGILSYLFQKIQNTAFFARNNFNLLFQLQN